MIIFGTSCLGNLYREIPFETKVQIAAEWFKAYDKPFIDSAGKYGAGLSLECIGKALKALGKKPGDLTISVKLGWRRAPLVGDEPTFEPGAWKGLKYDAVQDISYEGILRCYEEAKELLGGYPIDYVSVHDPDEYLGNVDGHVEVERWRDIVGAYQALGELKARGEVRAVGVGSKDWRVIQKIAAEVKLDWAMFACAPTLLKHPPELLQFVRELKAKGVYLIDSAVFNGGFLLGSDILDYKQVDANKDAVALRFREKYLALCKEWNYDPAAPAVEYAFNLGFDAVALNTSKPQNILKNAAYGDFHADPRFTSSLLAL